MSETFDPTKIKLTEKKLEAMTYINQCHLNNGRAPTAEKLAEAVNVTVDTARKWYDSVEFKYMMSELGIQLAHDSEVLLPQQVIILNSLLDLNDRRSKREKCEGAGITLAKLNGWMRDPVFKQHYMDIARTKFEDADPVAQLALLRNMEGGNQRAVEFYFELTGQFQRSVNHNINIEGFLSSLIEVLQARIQDPALLEQIANDFELLVKGQRPQIDRTPASVIDVVPTLQVPQLTEG